jgi:hypothetical protein
MSVALKSSDSTFCSAPMASCTASAYGSGSAPLTFFSRKLTASWSFAPAVAACQTTRRFYHDFSQANNGLSFQCVSCGARPMLQQMSWIKYVP